MVFTYIENKDLLNIEDLWFKELDLDYQFGLIRRLHNLGDEQEGKSVAQHNRKAKPYHDKAEHLKSISKIMKIRPKGEIK